MTIESGFNDPVQDWLRDVGLRLDILVNFDPSIWHALHNELKVERSK